MADSAIRSEFTEFIKHAAFPCVGAKSALAQDAIEILDMSQFPKDGQDLGLYLELLKYGENLDLDSPIVQSFAAIYPDDAETDEIGFEEILWERLQKIQKADAYLGRSWDSATESDPHSPKFSMSIGETSFFIIGLHSNASRPARNFKYTTYIFNSTAQFAKLRRDGRFDKLQTIIRARDAELAGDINPMLANYGELSEARQYSGRILPIDWKAPFDPEDPLDVPKTNRP